MSSDLRLSRSFLWLNVAQFLGALNDNVFKLLLIFLLIDLRGDVERTTIVASASAVFVLPFLLFSHAAGVLADRFSKARIIVATKYLEILCMILGCAAIHSRSAAGLYGVLFLMCAQSALFGPSKYGIVPELVGQERLSKANSLLVGLSYLAIIIGTFIPSFLLLEVLSRDFLNLGWFCVAVAVVGTLASHGIEKTPAQGGQSRFTPWFVLDIWRTLRDVRADRYLLAAILGDAYFLFLGSFIQQNALLYGQDTLGMGWIESGYLFPMAALGIGIGALLAGRVSGRNIEFGIVPVGALGLTAGCVLLAIVPPSLHAVLGIILFVGISSGLFIVPLQAFVQYRAPGHKRGEILAAASFLSFSGVILSAALLVALNRWLGLAPNRCFLVAGLLTAGLTIGAVRVLPDFLLRFVVVMVTRCVYRIRVWGVQHVPAQGPALLVSNHVTWVDALLLSATTQRRIRFLMAREIYEGRWLRPVFRLMGVIPISAADPPRRILGALHEARHALEEGFLVCIFAEGALTRNGNMRGFRPGFERIVRGLECPVVPVYIGDAWGSIFSYYRGRLMAAPPRRIPYPVSILFGAPMPSSSAGWDVRQAILELSGTAFDLRKTSGRSLARGFVREARRHWLRPAVIDASGARFTFGQTLIRSLALGRRLRKRVARGEKIGVLLPASVGGVLANVASVLAGAVPVNLNFTASREAVRSAIARCGLRTVLCSRAFLEKLDTFRDLDGLVFLEDLREEVTPMDRWAAAATALLVPASWIAPSRRNAADDPATVIFSSGSTGEPKGVVLSQHNILSNIESFRTVLRLSPGDRMCAVLPLFHSFGFTTTLWCPLLTGCSAVYHHNPLDGSMVARLVRTERCTILLATPTFLLNYIRRAERADFVSLRVAVTGAEKLTQRVADSFEKKFGFRPLEGYGTTELSPVVSLNVPDVEVDRVRQVGTKEGSIGHPIPGVAVRIVDPVTGVALPPGQTGVLTVKGPNVMLGYLGDARRTAEAVRDGWYDTGDIARTDEDGFVFIVDRVSRFSKIGGEMVPHVAIEEKLHEALGAVGRVLVVASAPDERKGEQLVVFHTDEAGDPESLFSRIRQIDVPNLWKPRRENLVRIDALPLLGSGKLDLSRVRRMACEWVQADAGAADTNADAGPALP